MPPATLDRSDPAHAGQAAYSRRFLSVYDGLVYGFNHSLGLSGAGWLIPRWGLGGRGVRGRRRPSEIRPGRLVAAPAGCGRHETPGT
jgi:hypothetical protein